MKCQVKFLSTLSLRRATFIGGVIINAFVGFLSTLSLRRATACQNGQLHGIYHFYPRSPCGERRADYNKSMLLHLFLSTLSLRRATRQAFYDTAQHTYFYPRSPCGERRSTTLTFPGFGIFLSTLSLRRATACQNGQLSGICHFYPRSPCGERLYDTYAKVLRVNISIHALLAESDEWDQLQGSRNSQFLSTLSLRRAT